MNRSISFFVPGPAQPAGSKRFIGIRGGRGRVIDANPKAAGWKERVALSAAEEKRLRGIVEPWDGALLLSIAVYRARPAGHYNVRGEVKASAPVFPTTKPDLTKIQRAIEDALTGILYVDDARIVSHEHYKWWADSEQEPGVLIYVGDEWRQPQKRRRV